MFPEGTLFKVCFNDSSFKVDNLVGIHPLEKKTISQTKVYYISFKPCVPFKPLSLDTDIVHRMCPML